MVSIKAEITDSAGLRIVLSAEELERNGLTFQSLSKQEPQTRAFLLALSRAAGLLLQFDAASQNLHIEVYPYADGGCLLCVAREQPKRSARLLFAKTFRELVGLCGEFAPYLQSDRNALYRTVSGFVLLLYGSTSLPPDLQTFLLAESENAEAVLSEYAELLIAEDAVGYILPFKRAAAYEPSSSDPDC